MSTTSAHGLLVEEWERRIDPGGSRLELIDGDFLINPAPRPFHQNVCRYLANAIDEVCPVEWMAAVDVEWRNLSSDQGIVIHALRPGRRPSRDHDRVVRGDGGAVGARRDGWASLDPGRPRKKFGLVLDLGRFVHPFITPDDVDAVEAAIREHIGGEPPA